MEAAATTLDAEEWRSIPDLSGYEASSHGRVRSVDRMITTKHGLTRNLPGCVLVPGSCTRKERKYFFVVIKKSRLLHRLIASAFLPNPDNLPTVDHIDRNGRNNHVSNLRWTSYAENLRNKSVISSTGYNNIYKSKKSKCYTVRQKIGNKVIVHQSYPTLEEAIAGRLQLLGF